MKRLFEFVGYVKHAVVIAADNQEDAQAAFTALGEDWPSAGECIGPDGNESVELADEREISGLRDDIQWTESDLAEIYNDAAHIVAA